MTEKLKVVANGKSCEVSCDSSLFSDNMHEICKYISLFNGYMEDTTIVVKTYESMMAITNYLMFLMFSTSIPKRR